MGTLESSFYNIENVETNVDCDHGPCVGITINHGDGPSLVWLFVETEEQAKELKETVFGAITKVQLVDYV